MWKGTVPICFYLFPVCSPKYEPEVFVLVVVVFFFFKLCWGRDWGGVKCLLRTLLLRLPSHFVHCSLLLGDDIVSQPHGVCSHKMLF